jgi:3-oxoacid CoA-transferase subunit B
MGWTREEMAARAAAVSGTLGKRALKLVELAPGVTEDEVRTKSESELRTS